MGVEIDSEGRIGIRCTVAPRTGKLKVLLSYLAVATRSWEGARLGKDGGYESTGRSKQ